MAFYLKETMSRRLILNDIVWTTGQQKVHASFIFALGILMRIKYCINEKMLLFSWIKCVKLEL